MSVRRTATAWPLLAACAWLGFTLWARPFAMPDEGRYAGVAWGMVTSGDWLVPHLNGLPYFHKPPLFYWITAGVMQLSGPVEWAARIAPWLGASAAATAVYQFARRWRDELFARRVLVALTTQVLLFVGAQFANLDMLVAGCIAVTVLAFAHAALVREHGGDGRRALLAAYAFAALGVLAKGLIGIVLPVGVIVTWLVLRRRWRLLPSLAWWPGMLLFLVLAAPWFVLMQGRYPDFYHYFFYVQHVARFAQGGFNNQQPAYFYPLVLLALTFPWALWGLWDLRGRRQGADALRALAWTWVVLVTLFFSIPQSKLVGYILPVTPALALLAADAWDGARRRRIAWGASAATAAALCLAAVLLGALHPVRSNRAIGVALRQAGPADQVVFLQDFWFDVPVYARLRRPVFVVGAWDAAAARRDNWRKELADAARFDPSLGRALLVTPADADNALCTSAATWVVGGTKAGRGQPMVAAAKEVTTQGDTHVWLLPATGAGLTRAGCPGMPSGNSADKS